MEETQLFSLVDILSQVCIPADVEDCKVWTASKDGVFSVASFFWASSRISPSISPFFRVWKLKAPPRVLAFGWLVLQGGILTVDNLRCRRKIIMNACPMCLADEETVHHFLLYCSVAQELWIGVLSWFDCSWIFPHSINELFESWFLARLSIRGSILWRNAFLAVLWVFWKERNSRCLKNQASSGEVLADRLQNTIASWVFFLPQFHGLFLDLIVCSWRESLFLEREAYVRFWSFFRISSLQPLVWLLSFHSHLGFSFSFPLGCLLACGI